MNRSKETGWQFVASKISHNYWYSNLAKVEQALDAAQAAGIKMIVTCPELQSDPEGTAKKLMQHPALEGYFTVDEPSIKNSIIEAGLLAYKIRSVDNNHMCYLNLMLGGKTNTVSGTPYSTYLGWFRDYFKPEVVSFDNYSISVNRTTGEINIRPDWYDNLISIHNFSVRINKPFWAFALSVSHETPQKTYAVPTIETLRLQVYSNLAYGAQGIQYFTFWTPYTNNELIDPTKEYYFLGPILPDGQKTEVYDLIKTINKEIKNLSFVFHGSTIKWIRHSGITEQNVTREIKSELGTTPLTKLNGKGGLLMSLHEKEGKNYLVVVNYEFHTNQLNIETSSPLKRILKSGALITAEDSVNILPGDVVIYGWDN